PKLTPAAGVCNKEIEKAVSIVVSPGTTAGLRGNIGSTGSRIDASKGAIATVVKKQIPRGRKIAICYEEVGKTIVVVIRPANTIGLWADHGGAIGGHLRKRPVTIVVKNKIAAVPSGLYQVNPTITIVVCPCCSPCVSQNRRGQDRVGHAHKIRLRFG